MIFLLSRLPLGPILDTYLLQRRGRWLGCSHVLKNAGESEWTRVTGTTGNVDNLVIHEGCRHGGTLRKKYQIQHPKHREVHAVYGIQATGTLALYIYDGDNRIERLPSVQEVVSPLTILNRLIVHEFFTERHVSLALRKFATYDNEKLEDEGVRRAAEVIQNLHKDGRTPGSSYAPSHFSITNLSSPLPHICPLCGWPSPRQGKCDLCW